MSEKWTRYDTTSVVLMLVLIPASIAVAHLAHEAGLSWWAVAGAFAALAVVSFVAMPYGDPVDNKGAVTRATFLAFVFGAFQVTGRALGVWEGWIMLATILPILAVQWLRGRRRKRDEVSP